MKPVTLKIKVINKPQLAAKVGINLPDGDTDRCRRHGDA